MVVGDHHHHNQHHQIDPSKHKVGLAAVTLPQSSILENTQPLTQQSAPTNRPTSYASSTLASTSSSTTATLTRGSSKKPLPAHIVDGVKASAALSASSTHQFVGAINGNDDHIDLDELIPPTVVSPPPPAAATTNHIRMIDTDDDIDQLNDNLILETAMSKMGNGVGMVRMSEQISTSGDMTGVGDGLDKHSYSFNNYDRHPPSFKTVMKTDRSPTSTAESHQYQNDDFDLDIHDSK